MEYLKIALFILGSFLSVAANSDNDTYHYLDVATGVHIASIKEIGTIRSQVTSKIQEKIDDNVKDQFDRWFPDLPESVRKRYINDYSKYYSYANKIDLEQFRFYCEPCFGDINKAHIWVNSEGEVISYLVERKIKGTPNYRIIKDKIYEKYGIPFENGREKYVGISSAGFSVPYNAVNKGSFTVGVEHYAPNKYYYIRYSGELEDNGRSRADATKKLQSIIKKLNEINDKNTSFNVDV